MHCCCLDSHISLGRLSKVLMSKNLSDQSSTKQYRTLMPLCSWTNPTLFWWDSKHLWFFLNQPKWAGLWRESQASLQWLVLVQETNQFLLGQTPLVSRLSSCKKATVACSGVHIPLWKHHCCVDPSIVLYSTRVCVYRKIWVWNWAFLNFHKSLWSEVHLGFHHAHIYSVFSSADIHSRDFYTGKKSAKECNSCNFFRKTQSCSVCLTRQLAICRINMWKPILSPKQLAKFWQKIQFDHQ